MKKRSVLARDCD